MSCRYIYGAVSFDVSIYSTSSLKAHESGFDFGLSIDFFGCWFRVNYIKLVTVKCLLDGRDLFAVVCLVVAFIVILFS